MIQSPELDAALVCILQEPEYFFRPRFGALEKPTSHGLLQPLSFNAPQWGGRANMAEILMAGPRSRHVFLYNRCKNGYPVHVAALNTYYTSGDEGALEVGQGAKRIQRCSIVTLLLSHSRDLLQARKLQPRGTPALQLLPPCTCTTPRLRENYRILIRYSCLYFYIRATTFSAVPR